MSFWNGFGLVSRRAFVELQREAADLRVAYDSTIEGWARALDLRNKEPLGHSERVTELTVRIGRALGMSDADLAHARRGALLHDIGTLGIPDNILFKPTPLTAKEWEIMRLHPVYAYDLLTPIDALRPASDIPYCHHEKWDGTGYPRGLKEEEIPLAARIFAMVDVWDQLRANRPYRRAWTIEEAREYILQHTGTDFDARVVESFMKLDLEVKS